MQPDWGDALLCSGRQPMSGPPVGELSFCDMRRSLANVLSLNTNMTGEMTRVAAAAILGFFLLAAIASAEETGKWKHIVVVVGFLWGNLTPSRVRGRAETRLWRRVYCWGGGLGWRRFIIAPIIPTDAQVNLCC